ncbi:MAG: DUF4375 domain-containing protein [Bacillota bacterium]|nr:DUF4375 domain-containing protein [Bacillota bacterium]
MGNFIIVAAFLLVSTVMVVFMPKYVNENLKNQAKYKKLRVGELENVPDNELENAALEWIFKKSEESGMGRIDFANSLPEPVRYFYATYMVTEEIYNGGFARCYVNSSRYLAPLAEKGFAEMGAGGMSEIMSKANSIYRENIKKESFIQLERLCENKELEMLSKEFIECEETKYFSDTVNKYIRKNAYSFGD